MIFFSLFSLIEKLSKELCDRRGGSIKPGLGEVIKNFVSIFFLKVNWVHAPTDSREQFIPNVF